MNYSVNNKKMNKFSCINVFFSATTEFPAVFYASDWNKGLSNLKFFEPFAFVVLMLVTVTGSADLTRLFLFSNHVRHGRYFTPRVLSSARKSFLQSVLTESSLS